MRIRVEPGNVESSFDVGGGIRATVTVRGDIIHPSSMTFHAPVAVRDLKSDTYLAWQRKANAELTTSRGIVTLGELRETIHAIRHPLQSLKSGISDYLNAVPSRASARIGRVGARSTKKRARAVAQAISGTYLEYANGWAPLISDVDATARTLAEHFTKVGVQYRRVEATLSADNINSSKQVTAFETTGDPSCEWRRFQLVKRKSSCKIVGEVVVRSDGSPGSLSQAAGFDLSQFIPSIWELIPLSYVADYFVNIGDILEGMSFCSGNRAWWSRTTLNTSNGIVTGSLVSATGTSTRVGGLGRCVISGTSMERDDPGDLSIPLRFELPGRHLFSKLANVGSLGIQAFTASKTLNRLIHG